MNIPVIYWHNGNQEYLKASLILCKKFNNTVYQLGDDTNRNEEKQSLTLRFYIKAIKRKAIQCLKNILKNRK